MNNCATSSSLNIVPIPADITVVNPSGKELTELQQDSADESDTSYLKPAGPSMF